MCHISALKALCSGWWIMPYNDSWHANLPHEAVHLDRCANAEYFTTCSVLQIFLPCSLLGLLLNLKHKLQRSRCQKHKNNNKKKEQGYTRLFFSYFYFLSALQSICSSLQGRRLPNTATMNCCQLHFSVIKFLDCKWTMGWTAILLCYADKLNQWLLASSIHKPQSKKIKNPKIIWLLKLPENHATNR